MARAARTCSTCPAIITTGNRCTTCRTQADQQRRAGTESYSSKGHRQFRAAVLARDPICIICRTAPATIADHYPVSRRQLVATGQNPNNPTCGRGLCKPCHDHSTGLHQPGGFRLNQ